MAKSMRQIAREAGINHSALSKVMNGKYNADPSNIYEKIIKVIGGVNIPEEKLNDILDMLLQARFPSRFGRYHMTAAWLYELITQHKKEIER